MITPQDESKKLARSLGVDTPIYLKREDLHPYRSHKGRSIPIMIEKYIRDGWANFCISSSGNAALATALYIQNYNKQNITSPLSLKIFVGKQIPTEKLQLLIEAASLDSHIAIEQVDAPKQSAFQLDKNGSYKNLRQSTDDTALAGYQSLADELGQIPNLSAVFIPTSSGTTAQGLHIGLKKLGLNPQIHIVQTPKCHPLVDNSPSGPSLANAIVDTVAYRKAAIQKVLAESKGRGWIATDTEILNVQKIVSDVENFDISPNSALSIAGLMQATKSGWHFSGAVVCLITGR